MARDEQLHEFLGGAVFLIALDDDLLDFAPVVVADRALDQVSLFIHQRRRHRRQGQFADVAPETQKIFVVALDLGFVAFGTGGPDDHRHPFRNFQFADDFFQPLAVGHVGDLARDTAAPRRIGHQDAITAGEGQIGGQCRALVAAFFLGHLNEHDLPPVGDFLDLVMARREAGQPTLDLLLVVATHRLHCFAVLGAVLGLALRRLFGGFLLGQQRLPVGDRDLVVVRMNFIEGQETVSVPAVLDERRLQRRFDPCHLGEIDVSLELPSGGNLDVIFFQAGSVDHHHPGFLRVRGID